jgi:hypothetical protein
LIIWLRPGKNSLYGSGFIKMMRLIASPAPQPCVKLNFMPQTGRSGVKRWKRRHGTEQGVLISWHLPFKLQIWYVLKKGVGREESSWYRMHFLSVAVSSIFLISGSLLLSKERYLLYITVQYALRNMSVYLFYKEAFDNVTFEHAKNMKTF